MHKEIFEGQDRGEVQRFLAEELKQSARVIKGMGDGIRWSGEQVDTDIFDKESLVSKKASGYLETPEERLLIKNGEIIKEWKPEDAKPTVDPRQARMNI